MLRTLGLVALLAAIAVPAAAQLQTNASDPSVWKKAQASAFAHVVCSGGEVDAYTFVMQSQCVADTFQSAMTQLDAVPAAQPTVELAVAGE